MPTLGIVAALAVVAARPLEHAKIVLEVRSPMEQATAYVDQTPPPSGKNPRPVVHARVNEPIRVEYLFTNVYPNRVIRDVVVHFYVARIEAEGQKSLPELNDAVVVLETALDMDFRPGGHAGGRTTFRVDAPGVYLVRVESRQTQSDHEHFAAVDLVVEP
ncbi:MAG: hypothetical protein KatS3mg108_0869 [Isosphaeraceae bacterium]|jgi:hypothetical protein|nr:MAG: hypothetical protein KatS3mg108_0869 [Isosphaeraceae bacterium]